MKRKTLTLALLLSLHSAAQDITLLAEITPKGQKITAVALKYPTTVLAGDNLSALYQIHSQLDDAAPKARTITRAYSNHTPTRSAQAQSGAYIIIELDPNDANASPYELKLENQNPIQVQERQADGSIKTVEKKQISRRPEYYNARLHYHISQNGPLPLIDGTNSQAHTRTTPATDIKTPYLDQFSAHSIALSENNQLHYRLYTPQAQAGKHYPLTIFLHGSGQVGKDNLAQLLSSKGAIATLPYEDGYILAPQYSDIFDPHDEGLHWQSANRIQQLLKMLETTLETHANIDRRRIYLIGLSRGAEGAIKLLQQAPDYFAGALLISGREADSHEWIDGQATADSLRPLINIPLWFIHSAQDKIAPLAGTEKNYQILETLGASHNRLTILTFNNIGDSGIINNNAHNSWDMVFDSPTILQWLLAQKRTTEDTP